MSQQRLSFLDCPKTKRCSPTSDLEYACIIRQICRDTEEEEEDFDESPLSSNDSANSTLGSTESTPSSFYQTSDDNDEEEDKDDDNVVALLDQTSQDLSDSPLSGKLTMASCTASLLQEIDYEPADASSIPSLYMINFLRQCFHPDLTLVDFPQSLVGLEYLEELEIRRKRCVAAALSRLGISRATLQSDADNLAKRHLSFATWVKDVETTERKAEALYTQLYIALRRWILLNEFCLVPFHKHNCVAMLNLLFPKSTGQSACSPTTAYLTTAVLYEQRQMYTKHIQAVEKYGVHIVRRLMDQGKRQGETTGWPAVRETLSNYLRLTGKLINEARSIDDFGAFDEQNNRPASSQGNKKRKTADSGVGFVPGHRNGSSANNSISTGCPNKPLPSPPSDRSNSSNEKISDPPLDTTKSPSALEKITSELRKFKIRHKVHPYSETDIEVARTVQSAATTEKVTVDASNNKAHGRPFTPSADKEQPTNPFLPSDQAFYSNGQGDGVLAQSQSRSRSRSVTNKGKRKLTKAEEEAEAFNQNEMMRLRAIWEARNS